MGRVFWTGLVTAVVTVSLSLAGCGGGGGQPTPPTPTSTTGTIAGRVVAADNVNQPLSSATVSLVDSTSSSVKTTAATSVTTDNQGDFTMTQVPVGTHTLLVNTTNESAYGSQQVPGLVVRQGETTRIIVTVLRVDQAAPTLIDLTPTQTSIDLHGQISFNGVVMSQSGSLQATPTYLVDSSLGTVTAGGVFTANSQGTGTLTAISGNVSAQATITVTPPRPPDISTFLVAPLQLDATGGTITITAAVNDGDGIADTDHNGVSDILVEIYKPDTSVVRLLAPLVAGDQKDGTYRTTWTAPANTNTPDSSGQQSPQRYSVRVIATDTTGASTASSFVDFSVSGLDQPPSPF